MQFIPNFLTYSLIVSLLHHSLIVYEIIILSREYERKNLHTNIFNNLKLFNVFEENEKRKIIMENIYIEIFNYSVKYEILVKCVWIFFILSK